MCVCGVTPHHFVLDLVKTMVFAPLLSRFPRSFFCYLLFAFISFSPSFLLSSVFSSFCQTIVTSDKIQRLLMVEFKSKYLSVESNYTRVCFSLTPGFSQFAAFVRSSAKLYTSFTSVSPHHFQFWKEKKTRSPSFANQILFQIL